MIKRLICSRYALFSITFFLIVFADFLSGASLKRDHIEVELVSEVESIRPGKVVWVGLRMKMEPGWHTYWRNPGETGLATQLKWQLPEGFEAGEIEWPVPEKLLVAGILSYCYSDEVLLRVQLQVPTSVKAGQSVTLKASARWLVCRELCIPGQADLSLTLPVSHSVPGADKRWTVLFANTRARLPLLQHDWEIIADWQSGKFQINLIPPAEGRMTLKEVVFFPYIYGIVNDAGEQRFSAGEKGYLLEVPLLKADSSLVTPDRLQGILFYSSGWRGEGSEQAIEISIPWERGSGSTALAPTSIQWGWSLILAFIGGLILNLMPCVLPVLSIKILGFIRQAQESKAQSMIHGLAYTVGILISFWVLAVLLFLLRAGGKQLGWGFQLQSSGFILFLATILFLFALNMFGVFEIGAGLTRLGSVTAGKRGFFSSLLSGVLATVVATPCTAPFMGTALGFALSQPIPVALAIFTALGLGLASPYILLSSLPGLMKYVPRAGAWMDSFKQAMGFPLLGTVLWLVWVLSEQKGTAAVFYLFGSLLIMGMGVWIYGRWGTLERTQSVRLLAWLIAGILIGGSFTFVYKKVNVLEIHAQTTTRAEAGLTWEWFDPERVKQLQSEGIPVFIDFTAAWCLSCKVNEKVALGHEKVQAELRRLGVILMKADWTNYDEKITRALREFGRSGIPLYVLYDGSGATPHVLPEIITPQIILNALKNVKLPAGS